MEEKVNKRNRLKRLNRVVSQSRNESWFDAMQHLQPLVKVQKINMKVKIPKFSETLADRVLS